MFLPISAERCKRQPIRLVAGVNSVSELLELGFFLHVIVSCHRGNGLAEPNTRKKFATSEGVCISRANAEVELKNSTGELKEERTGVAGAGMIFPLLFLT